jgi:anaerobic selenocysteine-containing dehydrogenase
MEKSGCPFCALNCTLEVLVEDDHIIDVRPNPDSKKEPGGYCCRKGRSVRYWQDNPERLDYPLKKVGDHFERISWEQAYREIGEKARAIYDKYGPKAFAFVGYGTPSGAVEGVALTGIKQALEAQYYYNPIGFEFMGAYWSLGRIFGNQNIYVEPDDQNVDTIVYWGANSYVANHFIASHRFYIKDMSEREDKRVIVVDPRLSETARMADMGWCSVISRGACALRSTSPILRRTSG